MHFCRNVPGSLLSSRRTWWFQESFHQPTRTQDGGYLHPAELCQNHLPASYTFLSMLQIHVRFKTAWNVCEHPTHCCCFRSPFCSTCLLGTVAHHFIVRAQLTSTISLQESFNSYYYKNRDKFLSLLQSMNCRYIYGWFDPGYKPTTALCLYPPHSMQFGKICLERIRKRSAAAGPPKPTSQLVCLFVCLICSMLLTPLSFCWAEFASQSTPWVCCSTARKWIPPVFLITVFPKNRYSRQAILGYKWKSGNEIFFPC